MPCLGHRLTILLKKYIFTSLNVFAIKPPNSNVDLWSNHCLLEEGVWVYMVSYKVIFVWDILGGWVQGRIIISMQIIPMLLYITG